MTDTHWADIAMSIYDRIQANPRRVALYKEGVKVKTSNEGSDLYNRVTGGGIHAVIGIYDHRASLDMIESDIMDAMRG